jgi:hypothetical protein
LVAQGVVAARADGTRHFAPAPAPTEREVVRLLNAVRRRIFRGTIRDRAGAGGHGIPLLNSLDDTELILIAILNIN